MKDYAKAERRADAVREALFGKPSEAVKAEKAERYAECVRIEKGAAAYKITFPMLSTFERGSAEAKAAWDLARQPMADVKAIPGRTFDKLSAAWLVPASEAASVELLAEDYGASIEDAADDSAALIAELREQVASLTAERDAALRLADEYAAELEKAAEAADTAYQAAAMPGEDSSGAFARAQSRAGEKAAA